MFPSDIGIKEPVICWCDNCAKYFTIDNEDAQAVCPNCGLSE